MGVFKLYVVIAIRLLNNWDREERDKLRKARETEDGVKLAILCDLIVEQLNNISWMLY